MRIGDVLVGRPSSVVEHTVSIVPGTPCATHEDS